MEGAALGRRRSGRARRRRVGGLKHEALLKDKLKIWLLASRPRTLTLSLAPVAVGAALAFAEKGALRWGAVLVALLAAAAIQVGTNLHNDAADARRGGDGPERLGPKRVTAAGLLDAATVEKGAAACFAAAVLGGLYLVAVGGWPILSLGLVSILCGWLYSSGPAPISATPFGELFVIAFFGLGATCGTFFLAAGRLDPSAVFAGVALGFFAAAVLLVNNHRDRIEDRRNGRRTLAILLGPRASAMLYVGLMLAPFLFLFPIAALLPSHHALAALAAAPMALWLSLRFFREKPGPGFNLVLAQTAQCQAMFALLLCLGALF
jgi:1,4-dihydroxy-2-naphthoate octaprenyltransferase